MVAQGGMANATTTDFSSAVPQFIVDSKALDVENEGNGETYWYYENAPRDWGYYVNTPEIHNANNLLNVWAFSRGWSVVPETDTRSKLILERIDGVGFEYFGSIIFNLGVTKNACGDSFAEIIWNKTKTIPFNLITISPERVRLVWKGARLIRYDVWNGNKWKPIEKEDMFHVTNNRIGDEIHGTTKAVAAKKIIDAINEALDDERVIKHRDKALGIAYYSTDKAGKIAYANAAIENGVKKGEMIGLPKDTVEIKPYPSRSSEDRTAWLQYLENKFYQIFGVPRSIASSDGTSEVGGKMGHVIFEPIYTKEQIDMERVIERKLGIKIKFNRPPALGGMNPEIDESKNTGQIGIQPNDVTASINRE